MDNNTPKDDLQDILTSFEGGISLTSKNSLPHACRFSRNLAIYEDNDAVTLTPIPVKDSGSVVTDLVQWIVDANPYENARYAYGNSGNIYRIASNTWAVDNVIGSGSPAAQGLVMYIDGIYYSTSTTIGRKFTLSSGSGTYTDDFFSDNTINVDINGTESGQTYTTPTSITENQANSLFFGSGNATRTTTLSTIAYDPLKSVQLFVTAKGSGNWTVTFHDNKNNNLGTATIANASLNNGQMNVFTFSTPIRINIGQTYHIHVTSTVGDGTVQTSTASNFSTAQVKTNFGILIADTNYHPMVTHTNGVTGIMVTGNEHYLATWDGVTYNPNKITLEPGWKVRGLFKTNEYVGAYCWKGSTIDGYEYGKIFYWNGIDNYYNFSRDLTQGMPNAIINFKNRLFGIFGSNGEIELAPDESSPFRRIQPAPKLTIGSRVEVMPGAIAVWQGRALFGYSNTNDANAGTYTTQVNPPPTGLEPGTYEFGNLSDRAISYTAVSTETLNFPFLPSTPIANPTNFKIGCIMPFGKDCYISYQDGTSYYVDRITKGNNPASFGSWESLFIDKTFDHYGNITQQPAKPKLGLRVRVTFASLPTGCTVVAKYRLDRATNWTYGASAGAGTTNATALLGGLGGQRYKEIEYGFDVTATVNYPIITSVGLTYGPLADESSGSGGVTGLLE